MVQQRCWSVNEIVETPSSTCDEGSEVDARSQSGYADFDDLDRLQGHRWEASSECSGEPRSSYGSLYPCRCRSRHY